MTLRVVISGVLAGLIGTSGVGCVSSHQELVGTSDVQLTALAVASETSGEVVQSPKADVTMEGAPLLTQPAVSEEYTVQPEDVLQITVYEEPDLTTKARVISSGEITFPLLGRVAVAGLPLPQVQEKLTALLAQDYLVNPQVHVFIESYHPRNVFVTGAVNKPGSYAIPTEKPTTLMEAIVMAGGFSDEAAVNGTKIIRIENGQQKTIQVKVSDIIKKGDKTKDAVVRPNDFIFVPESFF